MASSGQALISQSFGVVECWVPLQDSFLLYPGWYISSKTLLIPWWESGVKVPIFPSTEYKSEGPLLSTGFINTFIVTALQFKFFVFGLTVSHHLHTGIFLKASPKNSPTH